MIAIAGGKGGCGKTTTALGVARSLADAGGRPLVVDADCDMPNLHTMGETGRRPGLGAVTSGDPVEPCIHRSRAVPGVDILPAGEASGAAAESALCRLRDRPETVLLDCPAGATDGVAAPLRAADGALVVSTANRESLADAAKTARMASALGTAVLGGVVTRVDDDTAPKLVSGGPLREECRVLATVPETPGGPLSSRVGRASYDRVVQALQRRNI